MRKLVFVAAVLAIAATAFAGEADELIVQMKGVKPDELSEKDRQEKSTKLSETWRELIALGKPAAKRLREELQATPQDAYFQLSASMVLYQIEHESAHADILQALQRAAVSDNAFQFFYLCHRIARQRDAAVLPLLQRLLENEKTVVFIDKDSPMLEPRTICVYLYGVYGAKAIPALKQACTNPSPVVRAAAAAVLGYFGDLDPMFVLADLLTRDGNEAVRAAAANALGQIDHPAVVAPIAKMLTVDESETVRAACAYALGELQQKGCIEPLALALNDTSPQVRQCSISSLEYIGDEECSGLIANRLAIETDPAVRVALVKALGLLGHPKPLPALKQIAEKKSGEEARAAAEAVRRVEADGPRGRELYAGLEGKKIPAAELDKMIASLSEKFGEGIEGCRKTIYLSAGPGDLPKLEELRCRILWVVTNDTMDRLGEAGKLIRLLKRKLNGIR